MLGWFVFRPTTEFSEDVVKFISLAVPPLVADLVQRVALLPAVLAWRLGVGLSVT